MEGMHHKDAVINVGELKDSDTEGGLERLVHTMASPQDFLHFDATVPRCGNSVDPRMDEIGTRAPDTNLINGLNMEVERK
jgi:hypothetical protein